MNELPASSRWLGERDRAEQIDWRGMAGGGALGSVPDLRRVMALDAGASSGYRRAHSIADARGCVAAP